MYLKRLDKPNSGQFTPEEDLDEFDRIILQLSMSYMMDKNKNEEFENIERIKDIYKRRVTRKEFPSVSYIAYLQYGIIIADAQIINELITYGYKSIFNKLSWIEKIYSADLSIKTKHPLN